MLTHVGFQSGHSLQGPFSGVLARLDVGVALFFVVSGFLLFRPHAVAHLESRRRPAVRMYLRNRALRIVPVLWVAVLAAWILLGEGSPRLYVAHAFLVQIYIPEHFLQGLTQLWSLATEAAFYLLLPGFAALVCRGRTGRAWVFRLSVVLGSMMILGPLWMFLVTALGHSLPRLWLPGFIGWFAVGMLFAAWSAAADRGIVDDAWMVAAGRYPGTCWALAAALFALATTPLGGPVDLSEPTPGAAATKNLLYCLIGALVVLPCVPRQSAPPRVLRHLSGRVGHLLGEISYGLFAYHVLVLALVERYAGLTFLDGRFLIRLTLTLIVTLPLAALSYHLMERPLMNWARHRRRTAAAVGHAGREELDSPQVRRP